MDLRCPRCPSATLAFEAGSALGDAPCPSCHGTFVPPEGVERLVHRELGIEVSTLRELMGPYAGTQLTCPSCSFALSHVTLRGIGIEVCTGCGSVWLDDGELERIEAYAEGIRSQARGGAAGDAERVGTLSVAGLDVPADLLATIRTVTAPPPG